ncbi:MAG: electron transfer flavoprotein subunit alpha/FixB family protein [Chloroflexi bacterium]|nr:electron transfer flavoprotein subunit alpha/FixB family protein [Chloroflexota bacterium]
MSGIWVWIENADGANGAPAVNAISREALGAARAVADGMGQPLTALVLGQDIGGIADAAFDLGADAALGCDDASLANFRIEAYGPLVVKLAQEKAPSVILAGASARGRDLAAWVAADLDAGLVADGSAVEVDGDTVKVTRSVYAGKLLSTVFVTEGTQIITLRSRAFAQAESTGATGTAEWVDAAVAEDDIPTKTVGFSGKEGSVSLTDASIIVSGGRGVGSADGFAPVQELAEVLNAAVGASRAAVDAGWISYDHQVGQTGKTVSPDLYVANGISGAIQHQAGMRSSKIIVAVNKDADAPIFKLAHFGIVGDLFKVLPALTAEFKKRLD